MQTRARAGSEKSWKVLEVVKNIYLRVMESHGTCANVLHKGREFYNLSPPIFLLSHLEYHVVFGKPQTVLVIRNGVQHSTNFSKFPGELSISDR